MVWIGHADGDKDRRPIALSGTLMISWYWSTAPRRMLRRHDRGRKQHSPRFGLRLSPEKTRVCHIDAGFDFLGFRVQRHRKRGTTKWYVYTYPSKVAFAAIKAKVKALTRSGTHKSLERLCRELNPVVRGWVNYFRYGSSAYTFAYLAYFLWHRVWIWLRRKYPRTNWRRVRDRYLQQGWYREGRVVLVHPGKIPVKRSYYRGAKIPLPWPMSG